MAARREVDSLEFDTPEEVAQHPMSHTGRALAPLLFD